MLVQLDVRGDGMEREVVVLHQLDVQVGQVGSLPAPGRKLLETYEQDEDGSGHGCCQVHGPLDNKDNWDKSSQGQNYQMWSKIPSEGGRNNKTCGNVLLMHTKVFH